MSLTCAVQKRQKAATLKGAGSSFGGHKRGANVANSITAKKMRKSRGRQGGRSAKKTPGPRGASNGHQTISFVDIRQ